MFAVDVDDIFPGACETNLPKQQTCWELDQDEEFHPIHITTGCSKMDRAIGGGIPFRGVTEIAGDSSSGKTQLSLQLALNAQLPKTMGGLDKSVAYICTESQFPIERLKQMIIGMQKKYPQCRKAYTDHIFVHHISDMDKLLDCVMYQLPHLISSQKVGLVIIDSVASVFRSEDGAEVGRSMIIQKVGYKLHQIASLNKIAVLAINQVTASMGDKDLYGVQSKITPSLGLSWANLVTTRIMLSRTEHFIMNPPSLTSGQNFDGLPGATSKQQSDKNPHQIKYRIRILTVNFCPWLARISVSFAVIQDGLCDADIHHSSTSLAGY